MDGGLYSLDSITSTEEAPREVQANLVSHHEDGREITPASDSAHCPVQSPLNISSPDIKRGIYNLQLHGSRISLLSCYHFSLLNLIQALLQEHSVERPIDSVVVKSAVYAKKLKLPHHEFVLFELGNTQSPSLRNHVVLDRNRLDGASILSSIQQSNSALARDEFRFSCDGNRDKLLRRCDLTPYEAIETIDFPTGDLLPFYELATIALVTSHQRDDYHLLDANCYWFAGLIWEQVLQMYPEAKHEILRDGIRGKFAGLLDYAPDESERDEIGIGIQTMLSEMKTIITGVQGVCETSDSTSWDYVRRSFIHKPKTSKRTHPLLELLSSERAYASDLALIRDILLPLAQGKPTSFPLAPSVANPMHEDPPMSAQDVKIVFGNIGGIAAFADELSERLEVALGSVVPGGTGDDRVGELFCELAPRMASMYLTYITRHPAAVARYTQLSTNPTPAMAQYLATTRSMTTNITHAWDIPSLIIKPLQRLIQYPLILQTILEHTPASLNHPDRATLFLAREKTEQVTRQVNEGKRRWEVVKGVLESGKSPPGGKRHMFKPRGSANGSETGQDLLALEKRVNECAQGASNVAECVSTWTSALTHSTRTLFLWSQSFQRVVDFDVLLAGHPQGGSEAVRAFSSVAQSLDDLSRELSAVVREELVPRLHRLGKTSEEPLLLCAHAHTLAGAHYNLVNTPYSKSRPSGLLEASQSYLALSAQLREELPRYIDMFEHALGIIILRLSNWQSRYFTESDRRWRDFWIALGEGDTENSAAETVRIWWSRWKTIARQTASMAMVMPVRPEIHTPISDSATPHLVLYAAAAIRPFNPATHATHLGLPFLKLEIGDTLEILVEAGHPKEHKGLPIPYDDAPDCMLAARSEQGVEGWALARYLMPLA